MFSDFYKALTWKRAIGWLLVQWLFVLFLGHVVGLMSGHESLTKDFPLAVGLSVVFAYWLLPCSVLHLTLGYTDATMPTEWVQWFMFAYAAVVISLQVLFIRFKSWWLFVAALFVLVLGAAGCSSYAKTIHFGC
jgi:hypothetical protein